MISYCGIVLSRSRHGRDCYLEVQGDVSGGVGARTADEPADPRHAFRQANRGHPAAEGGREAAAPLRYGARADSWRYRGSSSGSVRLGGRSRRGASEMRLLLDTHIWIWSDLEPWRLTSDVTRILSDTENELWLSPISVWELIVHLEKKRITLEKDVLTWIAASKQELSLREAPMSWAVAEELRFVVLRHRDPADRFLVATARVQDLTLVTADRTLMEIDGVRILPNC